MKNDTEAAPKSRKLFHGLHFGIELNTLKLICRLKLKNIFSKVLNSRSLSKYMNGRKRNDRQKLHRQRVDCSKWSFNENIH